MTGNEIHLYLDLNGKLDVNYFQNNKIFFKMINVDKKPMVQIGNYVFEGRYEDHLGTKVFFVESHNHEPSTNIFERQSPIHLEYFVKTAKVLQLKWKSVPVATMKESRGSDDYMELQFEENYATVLEKFEKAELNIKDISVRPKDEDDEKMEEPIEEKPREKNGAQPETAGDKMEVKRYDVAFTRHEIFKKFNQLPKKQVEQQKLFEVKKEDLAHVTDASNYPVLKQLFLQNVNLDDIDIKMSNFQKYVNIRQSINDGIIPEVETNSLTDEIKSKLLHSDNFNNFTVPMKMAYLLVQLEQYKKLIQEGQNKDVDQFGRRLIDKYRLLKQLIKDLWYIIYVNKSRSS